MQYHEFSLFYVFSYFHNVNNGQVCRIALYRHHTPFHIYYGDKMVTLLQLEWSFVTFFSFEVLAAATLNYSVKAVVLGVE